MIPVIVVALLLPFSSALEYNVQGSEYNLCSAKANCYERGLCKDFKPGTRLGSFPNQEERTQLAFINTARLFPEYFVTKGYMKINGGTSKYHDDTKNGVRKCGVATDGPIWNWQDANEVARFHSWTQTQCKNEKGEKIYSGHSTCPSYCYLFGGNCGFGARGSTFNKYGHGAWMSAEGICGASMCYKDGHCGAMFAKQRSYMGIGFSDNGGSNNYVINYMNDGYKGYETNYPIPAGTHIDRKMKNSKLIAEEGEADKRLAFYAVYFDKYNQPTNGYVAYASQLIKMRKEVYVKMQVSGECSPQCQRAANRITFGLKPKMEQPIVCHKVTNTSFQPSGRIGHGGSRENEISLKIVRKCSTTIMNDKTTKKQTDAPTTKKITPKTTKKATSKPSTTNKPPSTKESSDWKKYKTLEYIYPNSNANFEQAEQFCVQNQGHLASIASAEKLKLVKDLAWDRLKIKGKIWIGLNDRKAEDKWEWTDGSKVTYTNWGRGEPNDYGSGEDCTEMMTSNGLFNDQKCTRKRKYVCLK